MSLDQLLAHLAPGSPEDTLARQVNFDRLPAHVAVIMDGNGRWAAQRHLPRVEGHRAGIDAVRDIVETSARLGIQVLTLYAFSVENWKRPRYEVATLMMLLKEYLRKELKTLMDNNIRFTPIGRIEGLDPSVQRELRYAEEQTAKNSGLLFQIALNYGGRAEIVDAAARYTGGGEAAFEQLLYAPEMHDPDLVIRTSGERRLSNYLMWQSAYSELVFSDELWPDFTREAFEAALAEYDARERRFGGR